jgi:hypothetical protein
VATIRTRPSSPWQSSRRHEPGRPASSARTRPARSSASSPSWPQTSSRPSPLPWPSSPTHSSVRLRHPPADRTVISDLMRRFIELGVRVVLGAAHAAPQRQVAHPPPRLSADTSTARTIGTGRGPAIMALSRDFIACWFASFGSADQLQPEQRRNRWTLDVGDYAAE